MKNIIKFIVAFFSLPIIISSCVEDFKIGDSFLEKAPGVDVTKDTIFGKAEYARKFLMSCYDKMYYGLPSGWNQVDGKMNMNVFESLSDCWHTHMNWDEVARTYYAGGYTAGMEDWSTHTRFGYNREECWEAIRASWILIENIGNVPDMDDVEKAKIIAEAKVIIASRYFDMYRHFGGLPIIDHSLNVNENFEYPRATIIETNDFMINLLDEAAKDLPWVLPETEYQSMDGRFTRAAALALKCKILLFTASPLFNDNVPYCTEEPQEAVNKQYVWTGKYMPELWERCLRACEEFFNEVKEKGGYHLLQATTNTNKPLTSPLNGYRTAFRDSYTLRGSGYDNPELLISTRLNYNNYAYFRNGSVPGGAFTPTQEYVEMFPMSDGTPFSWKDKDDIDKMFTHRDPRLFETILVNYVDYKGLKAELWVGGREMKQGTVTESGQFATGYGIYKYVLDGQLNWGRPTFWPYLRMAEVHLIYAEALMKAGRYDEAISEVDKVRARVNLPGLRESLPNIDLNNEKNLLNEILRERACELGMEDVRLFDMIRHKMAERFTTKLHGLRTTLVSKNPMTFNYEIFELKNPTRFMWKEGYEFSSKWYLTAFPPSEVNKGYGLVQNPGW